MAARAAEPTPVDVPGPGPGMAETDPEALWGTVLRLLRRIAAGAAPNAGAIRGLAVASVGEAGVLLDGAGRPLAPIMAWYDARTGGELERLVAAFGVERLHAITGLCPDPTFGLLKLLWLRRHRPEAFAAARCWLNVADWLAWRLCGGRATDHGLASRTMLLDLERLDWSAPLLDHAGLTRGMLPPLLASGARLGRLRGEVVAATGLPPDLAVGVGGHDHVCAMIAAGADRPGVLLDCVGTAEALSLARAGAPLADPALARDGLNQGAVRADPPLFYLFGGLPTAAAAVDWFAGLHGLGLAALVAEAEAAPPGSGGVRFLPHLRLGSPPFPDPASRGAFVGLAADTGRGALFRAVLEGVALDVGLVRRAMERHLAGNPAPERIVAVGGSTRNRLLMRLKASAFGRPLAVLDLPDATALGAALLGGVAAGLFADVAQAQRGLRLPERAAEPLPGWDAAAALADHAAARAALRPVHARLVGGR